jgi:hypothetical protein
MTGTLHESRAYRRPAASRRDGAAVLLVGFLAAWVAVLLAHGAPATGYETDVYAATPIAFWIAVAVAGTCALTVFALGPSRWQRLGALVLGGQAVVTVVGLRLLRGYAFTTTGDALSHMGWIRDALGGEFALTELIYPGPHTVAVYLHRLLGLELDHAMQLTVVTFAAIFVVFLPAVVAVLSDSAAAPIVGLLAAAMFLPINNVGGHLTFFPSTLAILLLPFVLLLAVVVSRTDASSLGSPVDWFLGLGALAVLFVHPQQAINLLVVFATVTVGAHLIRRRAGIRSVSPLFRHTALLGVAIVAWGGLHERITEAAGAYVGRVLSTLSGGGTEAGATVAQRTGSLAAIGVSPLELGLKLFLPSLVFLALTGILVVRLVRNLRRGVDVGATQATIGIGLVAVGGIMVVYLIGGLRQIYFRHLGFIMVLATVLGAVALARGLRGLADRPFGRIWRGAVVVGLVGVLVLSVATAFPSPFIYTTNGHVTEAAFSGHATAFAHESADVEYAGIRTGPDRFRDALLGTGALESADVRRATRVPFGRLDEDLTTVFDGPRYVVVTREDAYRETTLYGSLRYSERGFARLGADPGVHRIVSNGEFRLFYVDG